MALQYLLLLLTVVEWSRPFTLAPRPHSTAFAACTRRQRVDFKNYPSFAKLREVLSELVGAPRPLYAELNHYFNARKCGIGYRTPSSLRMPAAPPVQPASLPL